MSRMTGGYALANALRLSGPIVIVVSGVLIGNHGRLLAMSDETRLHLDIFWELVDEMESIREITDPLSLNYRMPSGKMA